MSYQSLAVHNAACNWIFRQFQDCEKEHPYGKFIGYCEQIQKKMNECIKEQREINRNKSAQFRYSRLERQETLRKESDN